MLTSQKVVEMTYSVLSPEQHKMLSLEEAQHDLDVLFEDGQPEKPADLTAEKYMLLWNTIYANETQEEKINYFVKYHFIHSIDKYNVPICEQDAQLVLEEMQSDGLQVPKGLTPKKYMEIWNVLTEEFFDSYNKKEEDGKKMGNARTKAQTKYDNENTTRLHLKLNLKTDSDILEMLETKENKQGYIKALIRADIEKNKQ